MEKTDVIRDLIEKKQISMSAKRVQSNPILVWDEHPEGVAHYRVRLLRPRREMKAYLSVDPNDGGPSLPNVMLMLAMDASGCKMLEGYSEFRDEFVSMFAGDDGNLHEMERFWNEYRARLKQSEDFRNFLGHSDYDHLVQHFTLDLNQLEGFTFPTLSEGDKETGVIAL
jgi:hypothetical protein